MNVFLYLSFSGIKPHKCHDPNCSKVFSDRTLRDRHFAAIHLKNLPKPHECEVCGRRFSSKSGLDSHMVTHTGDKPYRCSICAKMFGARNSFQRHLKTHGEKTHCCPICGKMFAIKGGLKNHMVSHQNTKPYPCVLCGKYFAYKSCVKLHMEKIHKQ